MTDKFFKFLSGTCRAEEHVDGGTARTWVYNAGWKNGGENIHQKKHQKSD